MDNEIANRLDHLEAQVDALKAIANTSGPDIGRHDLDALEGKLYKLADSIRELKSARSESTAAIKAIAYQQALEVFRANIKASVEPIIDEVFDAQKRAKADDAAVLEKAEMIAQRANSHVAKSQVFLEAASTTAASHISDYIDEVLG